MDREYHADGESELLANHQHERELVPGGVLAATFSGSHDQGFRRQAYESEASAALVMRSSTTTTRHERTP